MLRDELQVTAELAMLEINDTECLEQAASEMLEYFAKMMEIDVDDLAPTTHPLVAGNRVREDRIRSDGDAEALVERAPEREDRFFKIPNIF